MRLLKYKQIGLVFGTGLSLAGAVSSVACNDSNFDGCEASKTCGSHATAGSGPAAGQSGMAAVGAGTGGKAASADKDDNGGAGGEQTSGHHDDQLSAGKGGKGGSGGTESTAQAGSDDGDDATAGTGGTTSTPLPDDTSEAGMGGEGGSPADPEPEPDPEPEVDTTPPTVAEVSPANGAVGVKDDVDIVLDFDEPMDNASTEAAYHSIELPPDVVDFYWKNDSRQLIIHPKDGLAYAEVSSPTIAAKTYTFTLGSSATDVAGNALGVDRTYSFSTLRHVTHTLSVADNGGRLLSDTELKSRCSNDDSTLVVGDTDTNDFYMAFVSFDITSLPKGIVKWDHADLHAILAPTKEHLPYGETRLGDLYYSTTTAELDAVTWNDPSNHDIGVFASNGGQIDVRHTVKTALLSDYATRTSSKYFLSFALASDADNQASQVAIRCGDMKLELDYWAP